MGARDFVRYRALNVRMALYRVLEDDYASAYRRLMKYRVKNHGAEAAVGVHDHDFGQRQFQFLVDVLGLERDERLADIGCGSLRAGKYLIPYLQPGGYVGFDVSGEALAAGAANMSEDVMSARQPRLIKNDDLRFEQIADDFDIVWGHSVVTHLPERELVELLAHLPDILAEDGQAFFSFFDEPQNSSKDFGYTPSDIHEIASNLGIHLTIYPSEAFEHPKGQRLLSVRRHSEVPDRFNSTSQKAGRNVSEIGVVQ